MTAPTSIDITITRMANDPDSSPALRLVLAEAKRRADENTTGRTDR